MTKTILLTGATDGIGFETAKSLVSAGPMLLLHGRSPEKLERTKESLAALTGESKIEVYTADLSDLGQTAAMADTVAAAHHQIDVIINNAGVFKTSAPTLPGGMDVRFVVNTLAPYILTKQLLPKIAKTGRVVNISSAAQAPVNVAALEGRIPLGDGDAYAQSKLAMTMWTRHLAEICGTGGPVIVAVNPASFLGSKMVKDAYGMDGHDLSIGADILCRAALSDEFADAQGKYYDNDSKTFADPHLDALDSAKVSPVMAAIDRLVADFI